MAVSDIDRHSGKQRILLSNVAPARHYNDSDTETRDMTEAIIKKLTAELNKGITTEVQVVYLLAGIRKLIERDEAAERYLTLNFHCDWALHSKLDRAGAKAILERLDEALPLLKGGAKLHELPEPLDRIFQMKSFREELSQFLNAYELPPLRQHRFDGWPYFLHLYIQVIEDIPLKVKETHTAPQNIGQVTVHYEAAKETVKDDSGWQDLPFKVTWRIFDREGHSGEVLFVNSFNVATPPQP